MINGSSPGQMGVLRACLIPHLRPTRQRARAGLEQELGTGWRPRKKPI
jgi:hypothetical protein